MMDHLQSLEYHKIDPIVELPVRVKTNRIGVTRSEPQPWTFADLSQTIQNYALQRLLYGQCRWLHHVSALMTHDHQQTRSANLNFDRWQQTKGHKTQNTTK
jgi:hypothetical protein